MKKEKKRKLKFPIKLLLFAVLLAVLIVYTLSTTKYWDGKTKLALAVSRESGDVSILVFDPQGNSLTTLDIPQSTEVVLSRQLGKWRLKNVPKIGEKEGIYGTLLSETLARHFKFPVYLWAESPAMGLSGGGLPKALSAVLGPYRTNLGFGDRLKILFFSMNVKNYKREVMDLSSNKYLKESILADGDRGYEVVGSIPPSLASVFADSYLSNMSGRTKIIDKTDREIGKKVGGVIEVVGLNVVSVANSEPDDTDCIVGGTNQKLAIEVARLFSCKIGREGDLDVIITIGRKFAERY